MFQIWISEFVDKKTADNEVHLYMKTINIKHSHSAVEALVAVLDVVIEVDDCAVVVAALDSAAVETALEKSRAKPQEIR
jgi:hypothetical protein